jgi:hypothetical protein
MESPVHRFFPAIPLSALLILTVVLTGYARWMLDYPICGTDEQNYLKIFDWLDNGGVWPISGPGYAELILELRYWTGWETRPLVVAVAALNSTVVLPVGLWLLYRVSLDSTRSAWRCLPWLFASSYFLGPWLEGRPQQLGMLLVMVGAWRAYRDLQEYGRCGVGFFLLWVLCFGYHCPEFFSLDHPGFRLLGAALCPGSFQLQSVGRSAVGIGWLSGAGCVVVSADLAGYSYQSYSRRSGRRVFRRTGDLCDSWFVPVAPVAPLSDQSVCG